jgi:hypothetical protein
LRRNVAKFIIRNVIWDKLVLLELCYYREPDIMQSQQIVQVRVMGITDACSRRG